MRVLTTLLTTALALAVLAAPARAAPPLNPQSKLYKAFESFISGAYLQDWFANRQRIERHYADPMVNYWGRRGVSLDRVLSDKMAYAGRWPERSFRLLKDSLVVVPTKQTDTYRLQFEYEYDVSGDGRRSAGVGKTYLTVTLRNERVRILVEGGRVMQRY